MVIAKSLDRFLHRRFELMRFAAPLALAAALFGFAYAVAVGWNDGATVASLGGGIYGPSAHEHGVLFALLPAAGAMLTVAGLLFARCWMVMAGAQIAIPGWSMVVALYATANPVATNAVAMYGSAALLNVLVVILMPPRAAKDATA